MDEFKTAEDFINDESFISWVFDPDEMNQKRWDLWLKENPDKKPLIEETVSVLRLVRLKENPVNRKQIEEAEQRLRASIGAYSGENKIRNIAKRRIWYAAAAVLIISVAVGMTYLFQSSAKRQLATNYGQIVKDKLPDGTEVILNAHSKLTLGKKWKEGNAREVWIKGEAFFHVKKTPEHDKFIVHTDAFDIEVTGTSFNVKNMNGTSSITLKEGSVTIHRKGGPDIKMKPGDYVVYENNQIEKKVITKNDYLVWTQNKLVFDNTKMSEVAVIIKEHYGVDVKIDSGIADKTITGIMPNDNLEVLLSSLEGTQEFRITRTENGITINKNQ